MNKNQDAQRLLVNFYKEVASLFIGFPADLIISSKEIQNNTVVIFISCNADDKGKLIGGHGATNNAMLTVCKMFGARHGVNVVLDKVMSATGERMELTPYHADSEWRERKRSKVVNNLLDGVCASIFRLPTNIKFTDYQDDRTLFYVTVDSQETTALPLGKVENDLAIIFAAVGKAMGRVVKVEMKRNA